jgi:hypothetical protein
MMAAHPLEGPRMPTLPEIGLNEHDYSRTAKLADEAGDRHTREAAKVGLYITLALDPRMSWHDKLRHFTHALNKHCHAPPRDHRTWCFYHDLALLVKKYCGEEALKLASREDDLYAARLTMGTPRQTIEDEAELFFDALIGNGKACPEYLLHEEFETIRMIRDQWI